MAWSWAGAAQGASRGARTVLEMLAQAEEQKRLADEQQYQRTRQGTADARAGEQHRLDLIRSLADFTAAGGRVREGETPLPMTGPLGSTMTVPVPKMREASIVDLIEGDQSALTVNPQMSAAAIASREQRQEQRQREQTIAEKLASMTTDPNARAALGAGASPAQVGALMPPPPKEPRIMNFGGKAGRVDEKGNFAGYVTGPDGKPLRYGDVPASGAGQGRPLPASAVTDMATLRNLSRQARSLPGYIDQAAAKGNVTGPVIGNLPSWLRNMVSPGSTQATSMAAAIEAQYTNLISGAAVSASEAARLEPFVPKKTDDEKVIKEKAGLFANELDQILETRLAEFRRAGFAVDGPGAPGQRAPEDQISDIDAALLRAARGHQ